MYIIIIIVIIISLQAGSAEGEQHDQIIVRNGKASHNPIYIAYTFTVVTVVFHRSLNTPL